MSEQRDAPAESQGAGEILIRCQQLSIGYRGKPLLPPFDLSIARGTFLVVIGRNGSGKTTFCRTLLGQQRPVAGRIERPLPDIRLAWVPQVSAIDPLLPVRVDELVGWGRMKGWSFLRPRRAARDRQACAHALQVAGIEDLHDRRFRELSEGMKQRVLLARLLASGPDLALLDEPASAMDTVAEREAMAELGRLARRDNRAIVVVSHGLGLASEYADRILFFDRDEGLVLHDRPGAMFEHPVFRQRFGLGAHHEPSAVEPRHGS